MAKKFITKQILPGGQDGQRLLETHLWLGHPQQGLLGPAAHGLGWPCQIGAERQHWGGAGGGEGGWPLAICLSSWLKNRAVPEQSMTRVTCWGKEVAGNKVWGFTASA